MDFSITFVPKIILKTFVSYIFYIYTKICCPFIFYIMRTYELLGICQCVYGVVNSNVCIGSKRHTEYIAATSVYKIMLLINK